MISPTCKFTCTLLVLMPVACFGQFKLKGTVRDASTHEPLPGVNVNVPGMTTPTATDVAGHFEFAWIKAEANITFSFIGYLTQTIQASASQEVVVELMPDPDINDGYPDRFVKISLDAGYYGDARQAPAGFLITMPIQSLGRTSLHVYPTFKYWKTGNNTGIDVSLSKRLPAGVESLFLSYRDIDYKTENFALQQGRGLLVKILPLGFALDAGVTYSRRRTVNEWQTANDEKYFSGLIGLSKHFSGIGRGDWGLYTNLTYHSDHTFYEAGTFKRVGFGQKFPTLTFLAKYFNYEAVSGVMLSLNINVFSTRYYCCDSWVVHYDYFSALK